MKNATEILTENEKKVIRAYKKDCYVSDYGWDSTEAAAWTDGFHKDCGLDGKVFSGVMSGLAKKHIIQTTAHDTPKHEAFFSLTEKGIELARTID